MRRASLWVVAVTLIAVSCGDGGSTLTDYAEQGEDLVRTLQERIDALDAEWEAGTPTLEGARSYWDRRLDARVAFLEGLRALDPPEGLVEVHDYSIGLFDRLVDAEQALAGRVATFETVTEHWVWWDTPEGREAQAVDGEAIVICYSAQDYLDSTEDRQALSEVPWIPSEMKEVVRVAFGCPE